MQQMFPQDAVMQRKEKEAFKILRSPDFNLFTFNTFFFYLIILLL